MTSVRMSKQDLQWQAESDANTMARYQEIMQDKQRMSRAIKEATKQAQSLSKRASVMEKAASLKFGGSLKTGCKPCGRKK